MGKITKIFTDLAIYKPIMSGVEYVKTFNDYEITRRAKSDPDALPLTPEKLKQLKRVNAGTR